ncbi:conserved hypothetical protein [Candidatus Sulfopaludibacter sp. SbA3]|nr:conserved hypothetical protein [Candidatus Sulfopaludibacter sp. SbA3]
MRQKQVRRATQYPLRPSLCDTAIVNPKVRAWMLILIIASVCAAMTGAMVWYRSRRLTTAGLLKRMPSVDSLVVYIDFEKLRQAGLVQLLYGSQADQDPEYKAFATKTDFHWAQDLDSAILAVAPSGKYIVARGRFDWKSLRSFVDDAGGECYNTLCKIQGSSQERRISFLPLQSDVMAMAVSDDGSAATRLTETIGGPDPEVPDAPIWLSIPASILKSNTLPEGTVSFARSVADSDRVTLMFVPEGKRLAAKLSVLCRSAEDAGKVVDDLTKKTGILRSMIAHAHAKPDPADVTGVLTAGSFQANGRRVFGYWPIETAFVEKTLGAR